MSWHHLAVDDENEILRISDETKRAAFVLMLGVRSEEVAVLNRTGFRGGLLA